MIDHRSRESRPEAATWAVEQGQVLVEGVRAWDLLGVGRRFEMWIGWSEQHWTPVCVKLPKQDSIDPQTLDALAREAGIAGSLSHPGVQRLLEARLEADIPHLVYEYVEGPTLTQALMEDGPAAPSDTVWLGMGLAAALHYIHGSGVVHLDLKPSNIALRDGRAVILDFDIALPVADERSTERPCGTFAYMAPEQIACRPAAPSMDLFALGAVLYEATSGRQAFPIPDLPEPTFPQLDGSPPRLTDTVAGIPPALEAVVFRLLEPDAGLRLQSSLEVLAALAAALPPGVGPLWPPWVSPLLPG